MIIPLQHLRAALLRLDPSRCPWLYATREGLVPRAGTGNCTAQGEDLRLLRLKREAAHQRYLDECRRREEQERQTRAEQERKQQLSGGALEQGAAIGRVPHRLRSASRAAGRLTPGSKAEPWLAWLRPRGSADSIRRGDLDPL